MHRWGLTLAFLFNLIETESLLCIVNPFHCHMSWSLCGLFSYFQSLQHLYLKIFKKNNIRYWNPSDKRTWSQISPLKYVIVYIFSSQTPMPSLPTLHPLGNKPALRLWVYFYFVDKFTCTIFEISGVRDIIWYLHFCVWLTVSQYDNLEVHPSFIFFSIVDIKRCRIRFLLLYTRTFF